MKNLFCIFVISLISTVLHQPYTAAFHVEPILSPITEFLYSYDKGLGNFLSNLCDCSEVKSCSCNLRLGSVIISAQIKLTPVKENVKPQTYVLESTVSVGNFNIYEEKAKLKELQQKCLVFEDKYTYVVNKQYCLKYKAEENDGRTKVCVNLLIKERGKQLWDEQIFCVED